jgi:uncharacterized protein YcfL
MKKSLLAVFVLALSTLLVAGCMNTNEEVLLDEEVVLEEEVVLDMEVVEEDLEVEVVEEDVEVEVVEEDVVEEDVASSWEVLE